jgi:hypothetical protein
MFQNFSQFIHQLINSIYVHLFTICLNGSWPGNVVFNGLCKKLHAHTILRVKLTVESSLKFLPTPLNTLNIDVCFGKLTVKSSLKFFFFPTLVSLSSIKIHL